jgi:hypothetical protein
MIEALIVLASVTITILGILTAHVTAAQLNRTNHETAIASETVRSRMEQVSAADVAQVITLYDTNAANDPGGSGTAPGATFTVASLSANSSGQAGSVEMPIASGQLREDTNNPNLGMPKDLNGDGTIDSLDHSADWKILPICVRLRWKGVNGDRDLRLATVLYR